MSKQPHELALTCDCVSHCSTLVIIEPWDDVEDEQQFSLDIHEHVAQQEGWRGRLRVAWQTLRGRGPYTHGLVLYIDKTRRLRDFLNERVPQSEGSNNGS